MADIDYSNSHQTLYETVGSFQLPAAGEAITSSFPEIDPILQDPLFDITRSLETCYSQLLVEQVYELCVMTGNRRRTKC